MRKLFPRRPSQADACGNPATGGAMAVASRQPERRGRSRKGTQRHTHLFLFGLAMVALMIFWLANAQLNLMNLLERSNQSRIVDSGPPNRLRPFGAVIRFRPTDLLKKMEEGRRQIDRLRSMERRGVRPPRIALVVGSMKKDCHSLLLLTLVRNLRELGYLFSVFALEDGEALPLWESIHCHVSVLSSDQSILVDWTIFEGVMLSSLEAKRVVSSLMQDPFTSVPLIWLIQEVNLSKRLSSYIALGKEELITEWRSAFSRANVMVFSDFSLPMMYASLDAGNFYVIPGSPTDAWAAKKYITSHSRHALREKYGFHEQDLIITIIKSSFLYDDMPWDYSASMLMFQFMKIARIKELAGTLKFALLCGNATDSFGSSFEELASRMGFPFDSMNHYGMDGDVNGYIMIADIVLYGSFQEEQNFPPLLVRAMSFQIPIIVPNISMITKYVNDKIHGLLFNPTEIDTLASAVSLLIEKKRLSALAYSVAYNGRLLAENMFVSDCILEFANLLESMLQFPSDSFLPESISQIKQQTWEWDLLDIEKDQNNGIQHVGLNSLPAIQGVSVIDILEKNLSGKSQTSYPSINESTSLDYPTQQDWDELSQMEKAEDLDRWEMEEIAERMERDLGSWEDVYRDAKKSEKLRFVLNERDEGELERTGQSLCIYEIYNGRGVWPFLHHGSLYRGISLARSARRPRSDDVEAVSRLPILNDPYYSDLLCEFGAIFSVANKVDGIHKTPWIGFQSWHASGRKVALSSKAEKALENAIRDTGRGDAMYYWALLDMDWKDREGNRSQADFWSACDVMNVGKCRYAFEGAFKSMYGINPQQPCLPPMPSNGGGWSALHCWVMPTSSFLEFVMFSRFSPTFSFLGAGYVIFEDFNATCINFYILFCISLCRIFVDSLHNFSTQQHNVSHSTNFCFLGSSHLEERQCYCRVLEVLVNVWAYHSGRRMFYLDPFSGEVEEQHQAGYRWKPWAKYFEPALLKRMDEDLAEEAEDSPWEGRLWPLTGEVHWQGVLYREREEKYRKKMDKKRKNREKLIDRHAHGYRQKSLANP